MRPIVIMLLIFLGVTAQPGSAQLPVENWTNRPDSWAPAGVTEDAIPEQRKFDVIHHSRLMSYDGLLVGTDDYDPILVLMGQQVQWEMAPIAMTVQKHDIEVRMGILEWLGASARLPIHHTSVDLITVQSGATSTSLGIGDLEVHALYGLHETWPYRAHLSLGAAFPTGSVAQADFMPNEPGQERILPYPMQPGTGVFSLLPGGTFVAENGRGTVGFQVNARLPLGENGRGWTPGTVFASNVWFSARFSEWVSGSVRLVYRKTGAMNGFDPAVNPGSSPMAHPALQGGTLRELPIGVNINFAEGALRGNRLRAELILPGHQDLDGPQLKAKYGAAFSWGMSC
jgi:hypothetical protein